MKIIIYRLLLISSLLSLCVDTFSQEWIPVCSSTRGEAVMMGVLQDDTSCYKVRVRINGLYDQIVTNGYGTFHRLSLGTNCNAATLGDPALPLFNLSVAIPEGAELKATIIAEQWTGLEIGRVFPAQKCLMEGEKDTEFAINDSAYKGVFSPQRLHVSEEMEWSGIRFVSLSVCPFNYYASEGHLSVMCEFVLQVDFIAGRQPISTKKVYENSDPFHLFSNNIFHQQQPQTRLLAENLPWHNPGDLLIIVGGGLSNIINSDKMEEFRRWKAFKGFNTRLASTDTIGITPEAIKSFISQQYVDSVRYVLFVGDTNEIPTMSKASAYNNQHSLNSDYLYGCMGGYDDYIADVAIGRFCTNQLTEFCNMVDKTIKYEKSYQSNNEVLLVAHHENANISGNSFQACCDTIKNGRYSEIVSFTTAYGANTFLGGDSATNSDVIRHINEGSHIVNYRGHASEDFWGSYNGETEITSWNDANEIFDYSLIDSLNNETCAVFFSIACYTGEISYQNCMLRAFTRAPHGAVAFVGATDLTSHNMNNVLNKAIYQKLLNDSVYRISDLLIAAHIKCIDDAVTAGIIDDIAHAKDNALCYLIGGDPTLELWTAKPQRIRDVDLSITGSIVQIAADSIDQRSYCSFVGADEGSHISNHLFTGLNAIAPKPDYNFYAVVNRHNRFPRIIYCDFTTTELVHTIFDYDGYYFATPIVLYDGFGENGSDGGYGVTVKKGSKLIIQKGSGGVTINEAFECEKGAVFEIK